MTPEETAKAFAQYNQTAQTLIELAAKLTEGDATKSIVLLADTFSRSVQQIGAQEGFGASAPFP